MKIPITIVTGCLGSGKTTLLTELLNDPSMINTAVFVNEFGKVGLDHHLLKQVDEDTVLLGGGCVCCNKSEDLENALKELLDQYEKGKVPQLDRVVIETTGLADPAPITFTILTHPMLQSHFYVDCIITTVDAVNGHLHLHQQPESVKQITSADKMLVTKADLTSVGVIEDLKKHIYSINPSVQINENEFGERNIDILFGGRELVVPDYNFLGQSPYLDSQRESETQSISFTFDQPLDWTAFGVWLSMLLHAHGENILRVKGLLDVGEVGPVVLNGVQHIIHPPTHLNQWPKDEQNSHLILIVKSINPKVIWESLKTFQTFLGSTPEMVELEAQM